MWFRPVNNHFIKFFQFWVFFLHIQSKFVILIKVCSTYYIVTSKTKKNMFNIQWCTNHDKFSVFQPKSFLSKTIFLDLQKQKKWKSIREREGEKNWPGHTIRRKVLSFRGKWQVFGKNFSLVESLSQAKKGFLYGWLNSTKKSK